MKESLHVGVHPFKLPADLSLDATVVVPTVKGRLIMRYGVHAYYVMNFRAHEGLCLDVGHLDIMRQGWKRLRNSARAQGLPLSLRHPLGPRYHYGFNLLEQVMLMTVPHTATPVGKGKFIINLWSWPGYVLLDAVEQSAAYCQPDDLAADAVLGSQQWRDPDTGDLYAMSYLLEGSLARLRDPTRPVPFRVFKHRLDEAGTETVWEGELADYMHDILINDTRQYAVVCELGMYQDKDANMHPSKVLILDLKNKKHWILDRFIVAAHACFDPQDPNIVYFSNHNFSFEHSSLATLLKMGTYAVRFRGPAAIYKYELTPDGPRELGVFTQDDFFRLTNMHAFVHRGRKVIAAMGFPDVVFLIDAQDMRFIRTLTVKDPVSLNHLYSRKPCLIGTIAPSPDGEQLFVHTTGSFQIIDLASGEPVYIRDLFWRHICFNHMAVSTDTDWSSGESRST